MNSPKSPTPQGQQPSKADNDMSNVALNLPTVQAQQSAPQPSASQPSASHPSAPHWQTVSTQKLRPDKPKIVRVGDIDDAVFASAVAEADRLAAEDQAKKKPRLEVEVPLPMVHIPGSDDKMDIPRSPRGPIFDYAGIQNPGKLKAALIVTPFERVGNPFKHPADYSVTVAIDAGRKGVQDLNLMFRFKKNGAASDETEDFRNFSIHWKFNVCTGDTYMVQEWSYEPIDLDKIHNTAPALLDSQSLLDLEATQGYRKGDVGKVFRMDLASNFCRVSGEVPAVEELPNAALAKAVYHLMTPEPRTISVYFCWKHTAVANEWCFKYLRQATDMRLRPLSQYYDASGKLDLSLTDTPLMAEIGGGMYLKYDKNKKLSFDGLPTKTRWDFEDEPTIYSTLGVVREHQWNVRMSHALKLKPRCVYVMRMPNFNIDGTVFSTQGRKLEGVHKRMQNQYFVFGRLTTVKGEKESPPPEGSQVSLDPNTTVHGQHVPHPPDERWYGTVVTQPQSMHEALGTDFCLSMTKCANAPRPEIIYEFGDLTRREDHALWSVWLEIKMDDKAATREHMACGKFFSNTPLSGPAEALRKVLYHDTWPKADNIVDMSKGPNPKSPAEAAANQKKYRANLKLRKEELHDNLQQWEVLESACRMRDGFQLVVGFPGSGKTKVLGQLTWDLRLVGHKVLVCAPSNTALDNDAMAIYRGRPEGCKDKFLRLQTNGLDLASITKFEADGNASEPPRLKDHNALKTNSEYRAALVQCVSEIADGEAEALARRNKILGIWSRGVAYQAAVDALNPSLKDLNKDLPAEMTLNWRITDLMHRDDQDAQVAYDEQLAGLRKDGLGQPDIEKKISDGEIESASSNSKSGKYRTLLQAFLDNDGHLGKEENKAFKRCRKEMASRILEETDIFLVTFNNAGSEIALGGFEATAAVFEEVAQGTLPAVLVPTTSFLKVQGIWWFGDVEQLKPTVLDMETSEVAGNSKISPLEMAVGKQGAPVRALEIQYRMCPTIATLVGRFYNNQIVTHTSAVADNPTREKVRQVIGQYYGQEYPEEVAFVNVDRGISRVEPNGTSLQNYANADAIRLAVERCLAAGIDASQISIITFYRGQKNLLQGGKIEADMIHEVSTVDAYQGKQNDVIFVDYVTARSLYGNYHEQQQDWDPEVTTQGEEQYGTVTAHVKNRNRNCVAFSRARYGLFIFGQTIQFAKKDDSLLRRMMKEFYELRHIAYHDDEHFDTHPLALEKRAEMSEKSIKFEQAQEDSLRQHVFVEMRQGPRLQQGNSQSSRTRGQPQQQQGNQRGNQRARGNSTGHRGPRGGQGGQGRQPLPPPPS